MFSRLAGKIIWWKPWNVFTGCPCHLPPKVLCRNKCMQNNKAITAFTIAFSPLPLHLFKHTKFDLSLWTGLISPAKKRLCFSSAMVQDLIWYCAFNWPIMCVYLLVLFIHWPMDCSTDGIGCLKLCRLFALFWFQQTPAQIKNIKKSTPQTYATHTKYTWNTYRTIHILALIKTKKYLVQNTKN